jgi:hypothetical protein
MTPPLADDEDELQDWEYPDPDEDESGGSDTIVCPRCGTDVFDDAEQCPVCRHYILDAELRKPLSVAGRWGWWGIVIVILLLTIFLWGAWR